MVSQDRAMYLWHTVNCEYFDVKIFSDSMACVKIKGTKYMRNIYDNAVQGHLSENYLTEKLSHEIFQTQNIRDLQYTHAQCNTLCMR